MALVDAIANVVSALADADLFYVGDNTGVGTYQDGQVSALAIRNYVRTGPFAVIGNASAGAEIRLPEDTDNGSNYVALKAPDSLASNITFTLPTADGTNGQALVTNGSGALSWGSFSAATPFSVTGNATAGAEIRLPEDTDNGSNYVALKAPDTLASNITFTLPSADGTNGQALVTNGSGVLSFTTISGGGAAAPLTLASGTIATDSNALTITQTLNNGSTAFSGALKIDVTNTASASGSAVADFLVGGTSKYKFRVDGFFMLNNDQDTTLSAGFSKQVTIGRAVSAMLSVDCSYGADQGYTKTGSGGAFAWASAGGSTNGADLKLTRAASNVLQVSTTATAATAIKTGRFTVAGLPAAASHDGSFALVSDANATTPRSTVAGGGTNKVMVMSDGTNWIIVA